MNKYFPFKNIKAAKDTYEFFNNILELVAASTGAVCAVFSPKGEQISSTFNHNKFCEKLSKCLPAEVFNQTCASQHKEAFLECYKTRKPIFFHCSFGLLNYILPTVVEDKDFFIFVGQVLSESKNIDFLNQISQKFPLAANAAKDYNALSTVSARKLKEIVRHFSHLLDSAVKRYKEIRERGEKLAAFKNQMQSYFIEIGTAMGSSLNLHELLNLIIKVSTRLVNASSGSICLVENKNLVTRVNYGPYFEKDLSCATGGHATGGHATGSINIRENLIGWNDENKIAYNRDELNIVFKEDASQSRAKSYLGVPLLIKDEVKGVLNIYDDKTRDFSLEEIEILTAFANQAALAIDNIQLFQYEQTRAKEATNLYNAVKAIGQSLNLTDVVNLSIQQMLKVAQVNRCIMFLYNESAQLFNFAASAGLSEDQAEFFSMLKITLPDLKEEIWSKIKEGQSVFFDKMPQSCNVLQRIYTALPSNSCLIAPLFTKEGLTGLFYLDDSNIAKTFTSPEMKVIMTFAVQIAMAIQRARLLNKVEENFNHLKSLYNVSTSLGTLKLDKICELIVKKTSELLGVKDVSLIMLNEETGGFAVASHTGLPPELTAKELTGKIVKFAAHRKKVLQFFASQSRRSSIKTVLDKIGYEFILCVPMFSKNTLIGIINIFSRDALHFSEAEVRLIQSFANQAVTSIENALLYKVVQNKVHELASIFEVGKAITSTLNFDKVLGNIAENIMKVIHSDAISIMLLDEKLEELSIRTAKGLGNHHYKEKVKVGEGVAGIAVKTGRPMMLIDSKRQKTGLTFPDSVKKDKLKTILSVPLKAKGKIIGLVNVYAKDIYYYSQAEINLLSTLSNQAAMALENARLYRQQYQIAQIIQGSLMPQINMRFEGVEVGAKYIPSLEISGDYYDLVPLSGRKFAVYISDVAGKGTDAAIYTARGKYILKSFSKIEYDPKEVLTQLNAILHPETEAEKFISVFYAVIDLDAMTVNYASAGHEPVILHKSKTEETKVLKTDGLLIGVKDNENYCQETQNLDIGDILVLYTDGITEARSKAGEFFGSERLSQVIRDNKNLSSQEIVEKIYKEVQKFTLKNLQDDFTLLVIKF